MKSLPEGSREVRHAGAEQHLREDVGAARDDLPLQVPPVDAAVAGVARAGDDVVVVLLLHLDELRDELGLKKCGLHEGERCNFEVTRSNPPILISMGPLNLLDIVKETM